MGKRMMKFMENLSRLLRKWFPDKYTGRKELALAEHLDRKIRPLLGILLTVIAVGSGGAITLTAVRGYMREVALVVMLIKDDVAREIKTGNQLDTQRLLDSIKKTRIPRRMELYLVQNDAITASTRNPKDIGKSLSDLKHIKVSEGVYFDQLTLQVRQPLIVGSGNASLILENPFEWLWLMWLAIGLGTYLVILFFGQKFINAIQKGLSDALTPLRTLNEAIKKLATSEAIPEMATSGITELDEIRTTVIKTQGDLIIARKKLAQAEGLEFARGAYRRLIHDLHNPVAAISNIATEALERPDNPILQEEAKARIPRLARQLLAQIAAADKNVQFEVPKFKKEDLRECITDAKELVSFLDGKTEVALNLPEIPILISHDKVLMTRVLTNLMKNAVEAGAKHVNVSIEESDNMIIKVEDDGPGIPPKELTLFLQGRGHSTKRDRFGIGLSTVNHIVESHGGKVVYRKSKLGGAGFELKLKDDFRVQSKNQEVNLNA